MYNVFHWLAKKKDYQKTKLKNGVIAKILKPTYDQKPKTFFGRGGGGGWP